MKQVSHYSAALKESLLIKALSPNAPSVVELAKEFNIPYTTLYNWIHMSKKKSRQQHLNAQTTPSMRPQDRSAHDKLQAVLNTQDKSEEERGAYCRQHGIYSHHLDAWKKQALEGLTAASTTQRKAENTQVKNEVKQLQRDLRRKDQALAEVSALLILKKKADLLWGEDKDV